MNHSQKFVCQVVAIAVLLIASATWPQESAYQGLWDLYSSGQYQEALDKALLQIEKGDQGRELNHLIGRIWIKQLEHQTKPGTEPLQARESKQGFPDWNRYAIPPSAITAVKTVGAEMCPEFCIWAV